VPRDHACESHDESDCVTAMNDAAVSQAFFEAGASAFVSKAEAGDLLSTIKRLCTDRG
jgi:hypothetical protein